MTILEKVKNIFKNITIEPLIALYIIPSLFAGLAAQNLFLEKACRVNQDYSDAVCDALMHRQTQNYTLELHTVHGLVAGMQGWKKALQALIPCFLMIFAGSWSDRHGKRKPLILIPICGELLSSIGLVLNVYFDNLPMEIAGLTEALTKGITGGGSVLIMGSFSYIADITSEDERTMRIAIANACFTIGMLIGKAGSGILLRSTGFYGVFLISSIIRVTALVYGIIFVRESPLKVNREVIKKNNFFADFFHLQCVVDTFKVSFKRGRRLQVAVLLLITIVITGPMYGELTVIYLFTRLKFLWNAVNFSIFATYQAATSMIGTLFAIGILSHYFKIHDCIVGIVGSISEIGASIIYTFAMTVRDFYFAPLADIFSSASAIAMRSITSKVVTNEERGQLNSLFGVVETLVPSIYAPVYAKIYQTTISTLPGAFFLVGGGLRLFAILIFM